MVGFAENILKGESTYLQKIMFYIDQITYGSEIVGFEKRCDLTDKRSLLGHDYWEKVKEASALVEEKLFDILRKKEINLTSAKEISALVREKVIESVNIKR